MIQTLQKAVEHELKVCKELILAQSLKRTGKEKIRSHRLKVLWDREEFPNTIAERSTNLFLRVVHLIATSGELPDFLS